MKFILRVRASVMVAASVLALGLGSQQAQAVPSNFNLAETIFGVHIIRTSDNADVTALGPSAAGGTYKITMDPGAYITFAGTTGGPPTIYKLYEFYQVYDSNTVVGGPEPSLASQSNTAGWTNSAISDGNPTGVALGFKTGASDANPLQVTPGTTKGNFTFGTTNWNGSTDQDMYWGFHLGIQANGSTGNPFTDTGNVYIDGSTTIIPEPAFYQLSGLLLMGGAGMFLRARRSRKNAA